MKAQGHALPSDATIRGTLVVVDDDTEAIGHLRRLVAQRFPNVHVESATDGPGGLDLLATVAADVIVSDHVMPGMDGITFLAAARDERPGAFRILLTGFADTALAARAINEGHVDAFLEKPIDGDALARAIEAAFAGPRGRSRPRAPDAPHAAGEVLVVDDDPAIRAVVGSYLQASLPHVHVMGAATAGAGLAALANGHVDVILSDYRLPDMTGMEFLAKAHVADPAARTILFTGDPASGLARDASGDPAVDRFFIKPVHMAALSRAVELLLPDDGGS